MDVLALGDRRDDCEQEEHDIHGAEGHDKRADTHEELALRCQKTMACRADAEIGGIHERGDERQDHAWSDGHEQVIGSELLLADAVGKVARIAEEDLVEALRPAHALNPGCLERDRLLIEELCRCVADLDVVRGAERRELDVLREQVEIPAVHAADDARGDKPARARDGSRGAKLHAGIVQELRLAQEPERIGCRDPGGIEVLGVAVGREDQIALVEGIVHDLRIVRRDDVVGVEDEEAVILVASLVEDAVERIVEDPALALAHKVIALPGDGTGIERFLVCVVRAGICHDIDVHELTRIVLREDGAYEVADDRLLVVGCNHEGIAVLLLGRRYLHVTASPHMQDVDELVEVCQREEQQHDEVEDYDGRQARLEHRISHEATPSFLRRISGALTGTGQAPGTPRVPARSGPSRYLEVILIHSEDRLAVCRPTLWSLQYMGGRSEYARSGGTAA